jgi:GNAT superfamily N-acetyltransferase
LRIVGFKVRIEKAQLQRTVTPDPSLRVRKYQPADRQAVRDICARTCWMGEYRPELIADDWLWAEYWTRYFTDIETDLTWVVEKGTFYFSSAGPDSAVDPDKEKLNVPFSPHVAGYLTGTADSSRFESYGLRLMPGIVWHVIRRRLMRQARARKAIGHMLRAIVSGDMDLPARLRREFPATFHTDLLPEARQRGIGAAIMREFLGELARRGVPGVHAQTLSVNLAAGKSLARAGFSLALARPTPAFEHVHAGPIEVQTWTRRIDDLRLTIERRKNILTGGVQLMILHVTKARYLNEYRIHVEFNDGTRGQIDLAGSLTGTMFEPLTDKRLFAKFRVDDELGTIVWENGADLAPDYLKSLLVEDGNKI